MSYWCERLLDIFGWPVISGKHHPSQTIKELKYRRVWSNLQQTEPFIITICKITKPDGLVGEGVKPKQTAATMHVATNMCLCAYICGCMYVQK